MVFDAISLEEGSVGLIFDVSSNQGARWNKLASKSRVSKDTGADIHDGLKIQTLDEIIGVDGGPSASVDTRSHDAEIGKTSIQHGDGGD